MKRMFIKQERLSWLNHIYWFQSVTKNKWDLRCDNFVIIMINSFIFNSKNIGITSDTDYIYVYKWRSEKLKS